MDLATQAPGRSGRTRTLAATIRVGADTGGVVVGKAGLQTTVTVASDDAAVGSVTDAPRAEGEHRKAASATAMERPEHARRKRGPDRDWLASDFHSGVPSQEREIKDQHRGRARQTAIRALWLRW